MPANRYSYSAQRGTPGQCYLAQVFGPDGQSVLSVDSTADPRVATRIAKTCAKALTAELRKAAPKARAFAITIRGWGSGGGAVSMAKSRDQARMRAYLAAREVGYQLNLGDFSAVRAPEFDCLLEREGHFVNIERRHVERWLADHKAREAGGA